MPIRSNASAKSMLKYFMEHCKERGQTYYVVVPWDEKNLAQLKEYYTIQLIGEMMDYYFRRYLGPWSVKDFMYKVSDLAYQLEQDKLSEEHYKNLVKQTEKRMREAGYEV